MSHNEVGVALLVTLALGIAAPSSAGGRNPVGAEVSKSSPRITAKDTRRTYAFTCSGTASGAPYTQIGVASCDGVDTCRGIGFMNQGGAESVATLEGKFTLRPDGLGFVTYDVSVGGVVVGQLPIRFVVSNGGREIQGMPVVPGFNVLCDLKDQAAGGR